MGLNSKGQWVVTKGESWASIAGSVYGDQRMMQALAEYNGNGTVLNTGDIINLVQKPAKVIVTQDWLDRMSGTTTPATTPANTVLSSTAITAQQALSDAQAQSEINQNRKGTLTTPTKVQVKKGDTFVSLANTHLGDYRRGSDMVAANLGVVTPTPGQYVNLPYDERAAAIAESGAGQVNPNNIAINRNMDMMGARKSIVGSDLSRKLTLSSGNQPLPGQSALTTAGAVIGGLLSGNRQPVTPINKVNPVIDQRQEDIAVHQQGLQEQLENSLHNSNMSLISQQNRYYGDSSIPQAERGGGEQFSLAVRSNAATLSTQMSSAFNSKDPTLLPASVPWEDMASLALDIGTYIHDPKQPNVPGAMILSKNIFDIAAYYGYHLDPVTYTWIKNTGTPATPATLSQAYPKGFLKPLNLGRGGGGGGGGGGGNTTAASTPLASSLIWRVATG
jgi:hypothetical protein